MAPGLNVRHEGAVATLSFERPEKRNAIGADAMAALEELIGGLSEGLEATQVLVVRGTGGFFCAGVDLAWIRQASARPDGLAGLIEHNARVLAAFERLPQMVVAVLDGPAIGYGAHLALNADFVLAAGHAYLSFPESRLGFPDVTHLPLLTQRLGRSRALQVLLLGERLPAREAMAAGLLHACLDDSAELDAATAALVEQLLAIPLAVRREMKQRCLAAYDPDQVAAQVRAVRRAARLG